MSITRSVKRLTTALACSVLAAGALVGVNATSASASTISNGYVQLCAQGDYPAYIVFPYRGGFSSTIVQPKTCWYTYMGGNSWEPIDIYGLGNNSVIPIGEVWYDGSVSGIGIGAEGYASDNPYYWTW
ncbi:hypothetical protein GXW83_14030 [Streptacidiphilus sp. PB12-B1b]|uniref:hypothetical protein n=1 Tax=Streptacidiphilus sp. PB12-B1b TaxID=2705012 RepID=UPI0015FE68F3|nr:hypothetical protein [Streptacidiphilus sp. PB12-B1b]QMU76693.1 hypothetical protein GXW83_14030 [Streptacidiphilus sp. PB12-B1b]